MFTEFFEVKGFTSLGASTFSLRHETASWQFGGFGCAAEQMRSCNWYEQKNYTPWDLPYREDRLPQKQTVLSQTKK